MTMNKNTELSAETMAFIDTICENSNTLSERENVKRLILEILQHKHKLINLDLNDIRLLQGEGSITAFDVSVDASDEARMKRLVELISQKCNSDSTFCKILIMLICPQNNMLKIGEMNELAILFDGFNKDVQSVWGIAVDEQESTTPKLRGIILIKELL